MSEFQAFFQLGFEHIVALDGIDHILFIVVLSAVYLIKEWKKILILVTAFTIGHSLTLILAATNWISFNPKFIELLIPITIFTTAVFNLLENPSQAVQKKSSLWIRYVMAGIFGLIHGFAFSNSPRSIFALSKEDIVIKLFAFNLGIEVGQVLVVLGILLIATLLIKGKAKRHFYWNNLLSSIAMLLSVWLFYEKL